MEEKRRITEVPNFEDIFHTSAKLAITQYGIPGVMELLDDVTRRYNVPPYRTIARGNILTAVFQEATILDRFDIIQYVLTYANFSPKEKNDAINHTIDYAIRRDSLKTIKNLTNLLPITVIDFYFHIGIAKYYHRYDILRYLTYLQRRIKT